MITVGFLRKSLVYTEYQREHRPLEFGAVASLLPPLHQIGHLCLQSSSGSTDCFDCVSGSYPRTTMTAPTTGRVCFGFWTSSNIPCISPPYTWSSESLTRSP